MLTEERCAEGSVRYLIACHMGAKYLARIRDCARGVAIVARRNWGGAEHSDPGGNPPPPAMPGKLRRHPSIQKGGGCARGANFPDNESPYANIHRALYAVAIMIGWWEVSSQVCACV